MNIVLIMLRVFKDFEIMSPSISREIFKEKIIGSLKKLSLNEFKTLLLFWGYTRFE